MLNGLDRVGKSAQVLATSNGSLRERLKAARGEFACALGQPDQWPKDLLPRANEVSAKLYSDLDQISEEQLRHVADELLSLSESVHVLYVRRK